MLRQGLALDAGSGRFLHSQQAQEIAARLTEELAKFHEANPQRLGIEPQQLAKALDLEPALVNLAVARLLRAGDVQKQGAVLKLKGRGPNLSNADAALVEKIEATMKAAALAPPSVVELAAAVQADDKRVAKFLTLLVDQGAMVKLDEKIFMHAGAVEQAKQVALDLFAKAGGFETVQYRDALGVSRKFAVPLLDYFDTVHWTVRSGSRRTPGTAAREAIGKPKTQAQ